MDIEESSLVVLRYDRRLCIVYASPQAQQITAIPVASLAGKTNREAGIPGGLCVLWDGGLKEVFRSGQPRELDCEFPAESGVRTFRLKLLPETRPGEELENVLAIAVETAAAREKERSHAEEADREGEERFRIMADGCPSLIWVSDVEGKNQFLNRRYRQYFNAGAESPDGFDWEPLIHPEDAPGYVADFMRAVRGRSPFRARARVRHVDGEFRWVATYAEPRFAVTGAFLGHVGITVDITEQKQAEERVRESEEWFRSLFENMQEGFAHCRMIREPGKPPDYVHLAVNDAFETLTGLKDAAGKKVSELIPGIQAANPELFEIYGRVAATGKPATFETWVPPLNSWFSISTYCPKEEHFVSIFSNITERKQAEEALRDTNRRFEFATAAGHLGVWEWDVEADIFVWNDKMFEMYGVSKDSFRTCQSAWLACLHPEDRAKAVGAPQVATKGNPDYSQEYRVVRPDETIRYIKSDVRVVRDANGKPKQLIGLNRDITERKLAEDRLNESEKRFRQVVEGAPEAIFVQTDGLFRYVNPAALALYGAESADQLVGTGTFDRAHPDFHARIAGRQRVLRDERKPVPLAEERFVRLDGTAFDVEVAAAPFTFEGRDGWVVFFRDISDRKLAEQERSKLQEQFRQAQKMESIGRLAGGVAHDFNNLLTVINGYTDLLSRALKEGDPLREWVAEIGKAGEKAAGLTRQLLAFSRKQILVPKPLDLGAMVADNRDMLHRLLGEDIELVINLAPDLALVMADPGQLHQVLMNLVVNARDAMPCGGRLTIETAKVESSDGQGEDVLLAVSDTGSGIDPSIQDHIFDPFFTTKGEGEGTGLGLSTVYGIVQQCGGSISLFSEPGKGATFKISLPRIAAAAGTHEIAEGDCAGLRGVETVFVVEDQEPVRKLIVRTLKNYGYRVLEADQGRAALLRAGMDAEPIHLLITDVVMPIMTGKELAESFQRLHPETKVIYMSGYGAEVIARRGVLHPGTQFIAKPFAPEALAVKVRETLGPRQTTARILITGDESGTRLMFQKLLESSGYEVLTAANAGHALELLRAREFQLLVSDTTVGDPGIDSIRALHKEQPKLRIILISGALDSSLPNTLENPGAAVRLLKPVSSEVLLATVRRVLTPG